MPRHRLLVTYDGAPFHGWQIQRDVRTLEGELTNALSRLAGQPLKLQGASRTDAGVHALGQVAHFDYDGRLGPPELLKALNALAHPAVRVWRCEPCAPDFHARHDARGKLYRFDLWVDRIHHPLHRERTLQVKQRLDLEAMQRGASHLVGHHDFTALRSASCDARSPWVTLHSIDVLGEPPLVRVEVAGAAFLKYMVRSIVGTLLEVGRGHRDPDSLPALLASRDRSLAGPTARPHGLHLVYIRYPGHPWAEGVALTAGSTGVVGVPPSKSRQLREKNCNTSRLPPKTQWW